MRKILHKVFSSLVVLAVLVFSTVSSFAAPVVNPAVTDFLVGTFFDVLAGECISTGLDFIKDHIGFSAGKQCKSSPDGYHHCDSAGFAAGKLGSDDEGRYSLLVCTHCGEQFKYYGSFGPGHGAGISSDLQQSYDKQVSTLPAPAYNSDGSLYIKLLHSYMYFTFGTSDSNAVKYYCSHSSGVSPLTSENPYYTIVENAPGSIRANMISYDDVKCNHRGEGFVFLRYAPVEGYYSRIASPSCTYSYADFKSYDPNTQVQTFTNYWDSTSPYLYKVGSMVISRFDGFLFGSVDRFFALDAYAPTYKVVPLASLTDTYPVNTRPTSITGGNYGIVGDDGTINTVTTNNQIINETNNTYYNPATGETSNIKDWSYNYEDRSYTVTLESGDTSTVTYGDENISITENNVVEGSTTVNNYTIYYMVDKPADPAPSPSPSQDPSPSPSACAHNWEETSRTEPDCISSGSVTYTCSKCGETKTEILKAKGHDWKVERTVQTTYDEAGNLIQQGYTIYKCSVCGEQYKDDEGTGPPGGSPSDDVSGISALVTAIFDELPKLFHRFLDFLGVVFPYLPPEITLLLTFGVVAVVFIGIIKAIRR